MLEGLKRRHVYASTDNIVADVRCGQYMMGDAFTTATAPEIKVKLVGTAPFAKVHIIKDNQYVYAIEPRKAAVEFTWRDTAAQAGKTSYYYVRGEQEDGEIGVGVADVDHVPAVSRRDESPGHIPAETLGGAQTNSATR